MEDCSLHENESIDLSLPVFVVVRLRRLFQETCGRAVLGSESILCSGEPDSD